MDFDLLLAVGGGREDLALAGRDGGVAGDQRGADAAERLDAQRERGDIEQQNVLDVAAQHAGLDRRAERDDLIGVDPAVRLFAEEVLHFLLHQRHAGLAADEHDLVDLVAADAGVIERVAAGFERALDQLDDQLLELRAGQGVGEVLGPGGVGGDVGQIDLGRLGGGELDLGVLGGLLEPLHRLRILREVDRLLAAEDINEVVHDLLVEVVAAEEGVAVGRAHLEGALAQLEDRDVERAAAEVVDGDVVVVLLFQPVGERGGGGFVDDPQHVQPGDPPGVLGRVALAVVEVGGHGDHRLGDGLAEVGLRVGLELLQHHRGDLGRAVGLVAHAHPGVAVVGLFHGVGQQRERVVHDRIVEAAAHQPLDAEDGVLRVGHGLALGGGADEALAGLAEGDDGGGGAVALGVGDHGRLAAFHDGDDGVGGAEVDADYSRHGSSPSG